MLKKDNFHKKDNFKDNINVNIKDNIKDNLKDKIKDIIKDIINENIKNWSSKLIQLWLTKWNYNNKWGLTKMISFKVVLS